MLDTNKQLFRNIVLLSIFLNSGFLFLTDDKRGGIPYFREIYLVGLLFFSFLLLLKYKSSLPKALKMFILFISFTWIASAVFAYIKFGQPIWYGILEERRFAFFYLIIPIYIALKAKAISIKEIEKVAIIAVFSCIILALFYAINIIPDNQVVSFKVEKWVKFTNDLRYETRYPFGAHYATLIFIMCVISLKKIGSLMSHKGILILLIMFTLVLFQWFIIQKRSTMLIWMLSFLFVWPFSFKKNLQIFFILTPLFVLTAVFFLEPILTQYEKLVYLWEELFIPFEERTRYLTSNIILSELKDNYYIGMGALSLQWEQGFSRFYGDTFFLSDLGQFGILYRYGFLTPLIYLYYIFFILYLLRNNANIAYKKLVAFIFFAPLLISFSLLLNYGGQIMAVPLAILIYSKFNRQQYQNTTTY